MIKEIKAQISDHEKHRLGLKDYTPVTPTDLELECEQKNTQCIELNNHVVTKINGGTNPVPGADNWIASYNATKVNATMKVTTKSQHCWDIDTCTGVISARYEKQVQQEHENVIEQNRLAAKIKTGNNNSNILLLKKRLQLVKKLNEQIIAQKVNEVKLAKWNMLKDSSDAYMTSLANIFTKIFEMTTNAAGEMNDAAGLAEEATDTLTKNKDKTSTFRMLRSGRIGAIQKKTIQKMLMLKMVGKDLRSKSLNTEEQYGKVLFGLQATNDEAHAQVTGDVTGAPKFMI